MKILMIVSNQWTTDPRVTREKQTLEEQGHIVHVVDWQHPLNRYKTMVSLPLWQQRMIQYLRPRIHLYDAVHCHDFDTLRIGVKMKHHDPPVLLIYDAHEMYSYMTGLPLRWLEHLYLKHVNNCIAVDQGTKDYLMDLGAKQVVVVQNCKPPLFDEYVKPQNDVFTIGYFGSLSGNRMFPQLFDIIGGIQGVQMVFAGNGMNSYHLPNNVFRLPFLSEFQMYQEMRRCDALICMFNPGNLNCRYGLPNKLYEAMMVGRPLICTKDTHLGDFVVHHEIGAACDYTAAAVTQTIMQLRDNPCVCEQMGRTGMFLNQARYNWENEAKKLVEVYTWVKS